MQINLIQSRTKNYRFHNAIINANFFRLFISYLDVILSGKTEIVQINTMRFQSVV